jgi:CBS domain containing-hemolysin-like protein
MSGWEEALVILGCLAGVAACAGSETASYAISRVRVDLEARQHSLRSRLARGLLADGTTLLIVLLLGNMLLVELATWTAEGSARRLGLPDWALELVLALLLTPLFFFFGDLLPKELARRRPHQYLIGCAPLLALARFLLWPLERLLRLLTWSVTRVLSVPEREISTHRDREALLKLLLEGRLSGALPPQAEALAQNVLKLRSTPVARAMVPWERVQRLSSTSGNAELYAAVAASPFTRLPLVGPEGGLLGYVHQLDVLGDGPGEPVAEALHELIELDPELPVDRALSRLRTRGQRLAVVGTRSVPLGIVTLKDLVEEISGELAAW